MNLDTVARHWKAGEKSKMRACEELHEIVCTTDDPDLGNVAKKLKISVRTVGRMVSAGKMYRLICEHFEGEAEELHENLYYSHWATVGETLGLISIEEAFGYLKQAVDNEWSVDTLRGKVPHLETAMDFLDYSHKMADKIEYNIVNAPRLNVPEPYGSRVARIGKIFVKVVRGRTHSNSR